MWNLEKWYRWTYLQGRNRDTDVANGCVDMGGREKRGWGELGDQHWHIYTTMCQTGFPGGSDGKESACSVGDLGSIPG